jgi:ATP-binding protein involved in chromosome partitioning
MMIPPVNYGIKCMSMGFLVNPEDSIVWRGPMVMGGLEKILHGTMWDPLDILIVDLPPGTGDVHLSIAQTLNVSGAIIVSTPQKVALADATKAEKMFQLVKIPVLGNILVKKLFLWNNITKLKLFFAGLVENMASFVCLNCHEKSNLFGNESQEWAKKLNIALLGSVPLERLVMEGADNGTPIALVHPKSVSSMVYFNSYYKSIFALMYSSCLSVAYILAGIFRDCEKPSQRVVSFKTLGLIFEPVF